VLPQSQSESEQEGRAELLAEGQHKELQLAEMEAQEATHHLELMLLLAAAAAGSAESAPM
jgi:hypothetical protein